MAPCKDLGKRWLPLDLLWATSLFPRTHSVPGWAWRQAALKYSPLHTLPAPPHSCSSSIVETMGQLLGPQTADLRYKGWGHHSSLYTTVTTLAPELNNEKAGQWSKLAPNLFLPAGGRGRPVFHLHVGVMMG